MQPEHITGKKVLYGCLDWGSGHIARSIPLMRQLVEQGNALFVRCTQAQQAVFESYAIAATFLPVSGFAFRFKGDGNFTREMVRNAFRFRRAIRREQREVSEWIAKNSIDIIVSDHCYGLCHPEVFSIFLTHQVQLPPGSGRIAQSIHRKWMKPFRAIWIMDEENDRLAGELSQPVDRGAYIGHYSRFGKSINDNPNSIVVVISGPEPYAEQLFDSLLTLADENWTFVCPGVYTNHQIPKAVKIIQNNWQAADEAIATAGTIISRNGYTTLMDLKKLGKKAILLPTPGQLEQMYLKEINRNSDWRYVDDLTGIRKILGHDQTL